MDGSEGSALSSAQSLHEITSTLLSSTSEAIITTPTTTTTATSEIFNSTPDDATYIADRLGAKHLPLTTSIPISVVYAIIFVVGVLGNVSTICVILKNKYMHTSTNVYLANLAMSDLLTHLVAMPFEVYWLWVQYPWVFGDVICDAKMLTTETVTYSSILTIVAFTVERYLAICRPLDLPRRHSKMTRALWVLLLVWIISVTFSLPWLYYNKVNYLTNEYTHKVMPDSAWCAVPWNEHVNATTPFYLMISSTVVAFIIPFSLVTVLYYKIGVAMKRSSALKRCAARGSRMETEAEIAYNKGRQTVIRMLVAVVLVFFVCWTPFHAQRLMFVIVTLQGEWNPTNTMTHHYLYLFSGVGYYLSSCVNPLLYSVMSKRFRRGFTDMFKRNTGTHSTNSAVAAAVAAMAGVGGGGVPAGGLSGEEDPIPFPVNSRSNNGGCGRTVARFELKMAPRHVIPDQYKEDILKNAFKNFEDSPSSTFKSWAPGDNKSKKNFLQICPSQTSLSAVGTTTGGESQNLSNNCGVPNSRPFGKMLSKSPKLVVSWKRPNNSGIHTGYLSSCEQSMVQIRVTDSKSEDIDIDFSKNETRSSRKRKRNKKLRFSPNLKAEEVQINNDDADGADDEFLSTGSRALKSEGDTPDCISEELAQMIADSVKLDMMKSKLHGQNNPDC